MERGEQYWREESSIGERREVMERGGKGREVMVRGGGKGGKGRINIRNLNLPCV